MRIDQAVNKLLTTDAGVATLVEDRVYTPILKQTVTYPAIAHREIDSEHPPALDAPLGLRMTRFRVFSTARTYSDVKDLDEAVRLALQGFSGLVDDGASPPNSIRIQHIFAMSTVDEYHDPTETYQAISDFEVWSHEEIPS